MRRVILPLALATLASVPFVLCAQDAEKREPSCEEVFKNIKVFRGVPAKDLIPAMQFMAVSMRYECTDCHNPNDYAEDVPKKDVSREMVVMQRELNDKYFEGRLEVTCNSCHYGNEHPVGTPMPEGIAARHRRITEPPTPVSLIEAHIKASGPEPKVLTRKGKLTGPLGEGGKDIETDLTLVQATGGKYFSESGLGKFGCDGAVIWRDGYPMADEPAAVFDRFGRSWLAQKPFDGLSRTSVAGASTIGEAEAKVLRGTRSSTESTEDLYFDDATGLLVRMVNIKRSTIGTVVTAFDYSEFKTVDGVQVPMKVVVSMADNRKFVMVFSSAETSDIVDDTMFAVPKSGE